MLKKIIIGSANFGMPYGILNKSESLSFKEVTKIIEKICNFGISTIDTAYSYGGSVKLLKGFLKQPHNNHFNLINKFSVMQDYKKLFNIILEDYQEIGINNLEALLIHDPHNIKKINIKELICFLEKILSLGLAKAVGVSAYSFEEVLDIHNIFPINILQCPINPLNQKFLCSSVVDFCFNNGIEIHGRSLFLQGILLSNTLPESLKQLQVYWDNYWSLVNSYNTQPLQVILKWANEQKSVNKWVVGVASVENLVEILCAIQAIHNDMQKVSFDSLLHVNDPYVDPRNWPKL